MISAGQGTHIKAGARGIGAGGIGGSSVEVGSLQTRAVTTATDLDGSADYYSLSDNASISTGDIDFSFAFWTRPATNGQIITKQDSGLIDEYFIKLSGNNFQFDIQNTNTLTHSQTISLNSAWYFVYGEHSATSNTLGLSVDNGTLETISTTVGGVDTTASFRIGTINTGLNDMYGGRLAHVAFFKGLLTSDDRAYLYNSGTAKSYSALNASIKTNLESFWELTANGNDSHGSNNLTGNGSISYSGGGLTEEYQ
jgi:hypothetical protein